MRIAIVGAGISGLAAARVLHRDHDVTLFEREGRPGGHAHTVTVDDDGVVRRLDTGFLVFNRRDYPHFSAMLDDLGVASQPACMSFSVRCSRSGVEYSGSNLGTVFARRRNALQPGFWRMLRDLNRFYRNGRRMVEDMPAGATIADLVREAGYSEEFVSWHLLPLGSALWSAPPSAFRDYPVRFVVGFLDRHDLLELDLERRVQWRTVSDGSARYVARIAERLGDRVMTGTRVHSVRRLPGGVMLRTDAGEAVFDQLVLACHGDQALGMLEDPTPDERRILGAVRYQDNDVVLHTDTSLLPRRRRAWASWNYHVRPDRDLATVTYDLNRLQGFQSAKRFCVTLNETDAIDPARILRRFRYAHPQFSAEWVRVREERGRIQGANRTWFCGAYFGNGFHEDGAASAHEVVEGIRRTAPAGMASSA